MKETRLRRLVCLMLQSERLDPISVENLVYPGTPDVNYIGGWIELKVLDKWPTRTSTPVRISHFSPEQRVWLRRRWQRGGCAHLLLVVKNEWLLFDGAVAADHVGKVDKARLYELCTVSWSCHPRAVDFCAALGNSGTPERRA
jgi:hypothetical protein